VPGTAGTIADVVLHRQKEKRVMTKLKLVGAAAVALLLASPAVAARRVDHNRYSYRVSPVHHGNVGHRSVYDAYGLYPGSDFAPGDAYNGDFARRNTFN
jgi:hypothetical protein